MKVFEKLADMPEEELVENGMDRETAALLADGRMTPGALVHRGEACPARWNRVLWDAGGECEVLDPTDAQCRKCMLRFLMMEYMDQPETVFLD